jgi:hypothetical protein
MNAFVIGLVFVMSALATTVRADCPEGSRALSEKEQQAYLSMAQAIRAALPPTPAGWTLKDPGAKMALAAPKDECKGGDPVPGWYGTYTWDEQVKRNNQRNKEEDTKLRVASAFTPEEQKEMDDWTGQARVLERKAVAVIRTNPDEAARLRAEARPFSEKANAVRKAHNERIFPELEVIRKEYAASYVNPTVSVSVGVSDLERQLDVKEPLQIPGAAAAFMNSQKELVMSFGPFPSANDSGGVSAKPRTMWVVITGVREPAETIAKLFAGSSLSTVAKK